MVIFDDTYDILHSGPKLLTLRGLLNLGSSFPWKVKLLLGNWKLEARRVD